MKYKKTVIILNALLLIALLTFNIFLLNYNKKYDSNEVIVLFAKEMEEGELGEFMLAIDPAMDILKHIGDYALIEVHSEPLKVLERLQREPIVKKAGLNHGIAVFDHSKDTYSSTQWVMDNVGYYPYLYDTGYEIKESALDVDLDVVEAWEYTANNQGLTKDVVVAIIDTGVDYIHPDLAEHMWININEIPGDGIDNDGNGYVDDVYGWDFYNDDASVCHYDYDDETGKIVTKLDDNDDHGTHIAGVIGAVANNNIGIAGIASNINVKIMALKINGGKDGKGEVSSAIEAIKYATLMGADICNLSWGTDRYNEVLEQVIRESDALFVTAAGNDGSDNNDRPIYPAGYELDNLISVTFVNPKGELTEFSNYGTSTVDIAAPGVDIFSTIVGDYGYMSGSSMAAPHVTAVAAMLYSYSNNTFASNVKEIIINNTKHLHSLDGYMINPGIPSAYKAVSDEKSLLTDRIRPRLIFDMTYDSGRFIINIEAIDRGGSGIRTIKWFYGNRDIEDFKKGTAGTSVENSVVSVAKAGAYTFYCSDYAGNDMIVTYEIEDDTTPPMIVPSYTVDEDYKTMEIKIRVTDSQSGIRRVKYMPGKKEPSDFLPQRSGTDIILSNKIGSFNVNKPGIYTIYAIDNRGNHTVYHLDVKIVRAEDIKLVRTEVTLRVNERYNMGAFIRPVDTTDKVIYQSMNPKIAIVSSRGEVQTLREGEVIIEARTSGGLKATCTIIVKSE